MNTGPLILRALNTGDDLQEQVAMHSLSALARALQFSELARPLEGAPATAPYRATASLAGSELAARFEQRLQEAHTLHGDLVRASLKGDYVAEANLSEALTRAEGLAKVYQAEMMEVDSGRGQRPGISGIYAFTLGAVHLVGAIEAELPPVGMVCVLYLLSWDVRQTVQRFLDLKPGDPGAFAAPFRYNRARMRYCRNEKSPEWIREMLAAVWAEPATSLM